MSKENKKTERIEEQLSIEDQQAIAKGKAKRLAARLCVICKQPFIPYHGNQEQCGQTPCTTAYYKMKRYKKKEYSLTSDKMEEIRDGLDKRLEEYCAATKQGRLDILYDLITFKFNGDTIKIDEEEE